MADKEEGSKAVPSSREEEEKDAPANQDLSVLLLTTNNIDQPPSQGQRESCELSALFQSQIKLQREIPAGLFAKPDEVSSISVFGLACSGPAVQACCLLMF